MQSNHIVKKILKACGVALLFLFVLELCARTDDWIKWDAPFLENYTYENLRIADSLGFHNRPNARFEKWRINSHGFRGPDITMKKPDSLMRIVVAGASETFGMFESPGMDYPSQMQSMLDSIRPGHYQVINAGCAGMSPPRIKDYYQKWISRFDPDIIAYYPSPGFYLDIEPPSTEPNKAALDLWHPSQMPRIYNKARIVLKQFIPKQIQAHYKNWKRESIVKAHPYGWVFETPPPERLSVYRQHLSTLIGMLQSDSVEVIAATHASRLGDSLTEIDQYHLTNWNAIWPRGSKRCYMLMEKEGNNVIRNLGNELGISIVDLDSAVPASDTNFHDIGHFRNAGASIVAREFVKEILKLESGEERPQK